MKTTTVAITALLAVLSHAAMAAAQTPNLCQPAASSPTSKALLAAAQRQLADSPAPLPHLHTEGTLPNQGIRTQSIAAEKDWPLMRQAALAWRISGDPRYLKQVDDYLAAWADVYQPDFNPIDETNLDMLITAYALTADHLRLETRAASRRLISALGNGYIAQIQQFHGQKKAPRPIIGRAIASSWSVWLPQPSATRPCSSTPINYSNSRSPITSCPTVR